ncbi:hypothetical protein [Sphingobium sp. KCTC 72723]|uniref:hypothetical protein n=1 Tax=Sphingobium sp. KCTC 72723 TaxID=2733867 RepID=UPI00165E5477|nr:hypothetical protein [Sphingobium sp. KCTC 72723]
MLSPIAPSTVADTDLQYFRNVAIAQSVTQASFNDLADGIPMRLYAGNAKNDGVIIPVGAALRPCHYTPEWLF